MSELKTHAEIIDEMRFHGQQNINAEKAKREYGILTYEGRLHKNFADDLAAAHKREIENLNSVIQTQSAALQQEYVKHEQEVANLKRRIGDTAKLREAVVLALSLLDLEEGVPSKTVSQKDIDFMKAALAEPVRNCDVGSVEEQKKRFDWFCMGYEEDHLPSEEGGCVDTCPCIGEGRIMCSLRWAQMPYESEAAK